MGPYGKMEGVPHLAVGIPVYCMVLIFVKLKLIHVDV